TAAGDLDKLLSTAACKALGVSKAAKLKAAVVRHWVADEAPAVGPSAESPQAEAAPAVPPAPPGPAADVDLATFAHRALAAARDVARAGGDGVSNLGDKVMVNACWRRYEQL